LPPEQCGIEITGCAAGEVMAVTDRLEGFEQVFGVLLAGGDDAVAYNGLHVIAGDLPVVPEVIDLKRRWQGLASILAPQKEKVLVLFFCEVELRPRPSDDEAIDYIDSIPEEDLPYIDFERDKDIKDFFDLPAVLRDHRDDFIRSANGA